MHVHTYSDVHSDICPRKTQFAHSTITTIYAPTPSATHPTQAVPAIRGAEHKQRLGRRVAAADALHGLRPRRGGSTEGLALQDATVEVEGEARGARVLLVIGGADQLQEREGLLFSGRRLVWGWGAAV